ncbi:hypothetical protein, unknown function [Leishmania tarentolae]|uniref:Uncharacterized protein n=1 Tax=Leishmania tarentolae TaxID=5689 RepID=A0A640KQ21_LEITA|nr:hypothetical protein, unknown function [Leishmania tarentolae]
MHSPLLLSLPHSRARLAVWGLLGLLPVLLCASPLLSRTLTHFLSHAVSCSRVNLYYDYYRDTSAQVDALEFGPPLYTLPLVPTHAPASLALPSLFSATLSLPQMAGTFPSSGASHTFFRPSALTSPIKIDQEWPITASSATRAAYTRQAHLATPCTCPTASAIATPATGRADAFPQTSSASTLSAIRRFLCRSSIMVPFMEERASRKVVVLPPPIHRLYPQADETGHASNQRADHLATCGGNGLAAENASASMSCVHEVTAKLCHPRGDKFHFTWTAKEVNAMRMQQREYLRKQRDSPHAPVLVRMEGLVSNLLNNGDLAQVETASPSNASVATQAVHSDVANIVASLCTRAIPQEEYISSVFQYRMSVMQKRINAIPTGVVVPAVVPATMTLDELSESQRGESIPKNKKGRATSKMVSPTTAPTVTFPHPGVPFTYQDLAQDPLLLTAEQRADRRAALLHRRTLSEEVYGQPVPYM